MGVRTIEEIRRETVDGLSDEDITSALTAMLELFALAGPMGPYYDSHMLADTEGERAEQFAKVLSIVSDVVLHTWSDARSAAGE